MRLPIVQFPNIVVNNLSHFASVFATEEQKKHFCEYVTGLIAGDKATVTAINALFLNKNDQSSLNKFVTQASWDEDRLNRQRVQLELGRLHQRPISAQAGRLIVDDTMAHHTRCSMDALAYLHDHSLGHNVWAHNVVTSYYVNRSDQFPVNLRLYLQFNQKYEKQVRQKAAQTWIASPTLENNRQFLATLLSQHYRQKTYRSKTVLGAALVREAIEWEIPFTVVLFDSWFLRSPLVAAIQAADKDWIGACPKDRLVLYQGKWVQVQEFIQTVPAEAYQPYQVGSHLFWAFTKVLPMKNLQRQRVRLVASYEDKVQLDKTPDFYATNRKDWERKRILTTYLDRWPTETFNEDVKGNLGFEDYQLRHWRAIKRHWYLSFAAYSLLSDQGPPGRSRWAVRGQFQSTGQRCRAVADELLGYLVHWIARQFEEGSDPDFILQQLLA
jgi:SRSO17 transposase